jgi:RNA polymerase sigma factor (sigma-70 family)
VNGNEFLAARFESERAHLRAVAFRMLGSLSEADDAVQESWLRLSRSGAADVENLGGWLTTVVARVCLNMLRSRQSRREEPLPLHVVGSGAEGTDPEHEAILADSIGLALLVVLETLSPAERLAFVLHDTFAVPFDEIGSLVGRTPAAARQLASRARRRVRGSVTTPTADLALQREVVSAFLAASRDGDFEALLAVLDPQIVFRVDRTAARGGPPRELRGALQVARGAIAWSGGAEFTRLALVNGAVGVVLAPRGRLFGVGVLRIDGGLIVEVDLIADPDRLRRLKLAVLP